MRPDWADAVAAKKKQDDERSDRDGHGCEILPYDTPPVTR